MTPLEVAITQLGKEENPRGSNWGEDVRKYLLSVGINFPASWCMSFVYWCVNESSLIHDKINPLVKTGGVLAQWNNIDGKYKDFPPFSEVKPGDIFIMDFGHGLGHTGFIETVLENNHYQTIEGNTNDTGAREGYEVCRRLRNSSSFKGIIRI